ncbi:lipoprotein YerB [Bacillus sp. FJAT-27225]|uniref:DUF3048 domain-containing protein n=1 Tax=Bacillus sp. FJAT-27225 TaxID=1743144 RepID=UPI00080C23E8|nr:DUF3048 domain-containing protein [Bacillus sp. FJAT-27225]OCA82982.1 lipoprotein YerB [Bacillus sp. FJAT-27225]
MRKWAVALVACLLLLSACSKDAPQTAEEGKRKAVASEKQGKVLPYTFPLTGIGSETPADSRAFAVMINNFPKARPQSGLHKADIVYEMLAEGEITRFLAVFQSEKPENIGPVRSARDYYLHLAKGMDSIFIAHGYSEEAKQMISSGFIDNINGISYDGTLFKRANFRVAPHNSYITYENMIKGSNKLGFDLTKPPKPFAFLNENEVKGLPGQEALYASVAYFSNDIYTSIYEYDSALEKYTRYSNGELTIDMDTKQPVLLDNVFIAEMNHTPAGEGGLRDIDLVSGGKGLLLQKGKAIEVEWRNSDGRILPYLNGAEAGFVPGKTWVNIIPNNPGIAGSVSFEAN